MQTQISSNPRNSNIPAAYLVLIKDNKVLLMRRFNTGYEDGKYGLPAGHVEKGETFTQSAIREAMEEAGIEVKPEDLKAAHFMHRGNGTGENKERIDVFFVATKWQDELQNMEAHKCDDLSWFEFENLPNNIIPYIKQALDNIKNSIFYSEHGWI